jgi:hypothetical protein
MDEIFEKDRPSFHMESDDRVEAGRFYVGNLCCGEGTASSVIAGHLSFGKLFFSKFFEPLFRAKTLITFSFLGQPVGEFTINGQTLGLTIRTQGSLSARTFFPGDPQPLKIFYDSIDGDVG